MAKKKHPRSDRKQEVILRTLTTQELLTATGGNGIPGQIKSSSGGGDSA